MYLYRKERSTEIHQRYKNFWKKTTWNHRKYLNELQHILCIIHFNTWQLHNLTKYLKLLTLNIKSKKLFLANRFDAEFSLLERNSRINHLKNCLSFQSDFQSIKHIIALTQKRQKDIQIMEHALLQNLMEQLTVHPCTMTLVTTL